LKKFLLTFGLLLLSFHAAAQSGSGLCQGKFPNLLTDICWECLYPVTMAGIPLSTGTAEDYQSRVDTSPVCLCSNQLKAGIPTSFWEPLYMADQSNIPGCFPLLGGVQIASPMNAMQYGTAGGRSSHGTADHVSFYQVNLYINPALYIMGALTDSSCLDTRGFDAPYVSFLDPTHGDDTLAALIEPQAFAFASLPAVLIGTLDAIQVNAMQFGNQYIPWWFGSWGSAYPHTGHTKETSSDSNGRLLTARLLDKMHNLGVMTTAAGDGAMCGYVPQLQMDKRQYKFSRLLPFPEQKTLGTCCSPIGRSTILSGTGTNAPLSGYNNTGYFIFRKRDCCSGIITPGSF